MHVFFFALALALGPSKAVLDQRRVHVEHAQTLRLDAGLLAPIERALPEIETLGAILSDGVVLGELHLGLDGQPSMPFLNPFFYAQEIRITQVDPASLAGNLLVTARIEF